MAKVVVTPEQFEMMRASGQMDPTTNPRMASALAQKEATSKKRDDEATDSFLAGGPTIAGFHCRPMSLAVMLLFQRIGSPLLTGAPSDDPMRDSMIALWLLAGPEPAVLKSVRDEDSLFESVYEFSRDLAPEVATTIQVEMKAYFDQVSAGLIQRAGEGVKKNLTDTGTPKW